MKAKETLKALKDLYKHEALEMCRREDLPVRYRDPDCEAGRKAIAAVENLVEAALILAEEFEAVLNPDVVLVPWEEVEKLRRILL